MILNDSIVKVLECIDGARSVKEIIDKMVFVYGKDNEKNHIEEITIEAISLLIEYDIVEIKQSDEFDGWVIYE